MNRQVLCLILLLLALLLPAFSLAETAQDITDKCVFTVDGKVKEASRARDRDYNTFWFGHTCVIEADQPIGGIYFQYWQDALECTVQARVNDEWQTVKQIGTTLTEYVVMPKGTEAIRLIPPDRTRIKWAEITVYGEGDEPEGMPHWTFLTKADLMLLVAHPDDEYLWFGGLLPEYGGERCLAVQLVYLVPTTPNRKLELLDALTVCGITAYPVFGTKKDVFTSSLAQQYKAWSRNSVYTQVTEWIRRYKPDVIVTHDLHGEYHHGGHMVCADAVTHCIEYAADPQQYPDSCKTWGAWQVHKVYLHLYNRNTITLDWHKPLTRFKGQTAWDVANAAMSCNKSQTARGWSLQDPGDYDNRAFGLYYSDVGYDTAGNDLMENIPSDTGYLVIDE